MIFNLKNPFEVTSFEEYCKKLIDINCIVELTRKRPKRTISQNSYLHVLLSYFASQYGCSVDEAKLDFFKRTCNKDLFERIKLNKQGIEIKYLRSSAELNTGEMSIAIDSFRYWSNSVAGIYLPAAGEQEFLIHCQQEIEKVREYV